MKNSISGYSARLLPIPALLRRGFAGAATLLPGLALANPTGGQVVDGKVTITTPSSGGMVITEGSNSAIINWQTFSIGGKEYVQFIQPNSSSVILNRVIGNSPSQIFGNLSANGRVFLINSDGVLFGRGSSVDVGALVASTVNISDSDFKAGHYVFSGATAGTGVVNNGTITAHNSGFIVLNGDYVHNSGLVQAKLGQIVLASGSQMTLNMDKSGLIDYTVDKAALSSKAGVVNSGQLLADGGRVIMTAEVAHDLVSTAVNNTGLIRAQGISQHDGEIELTASGGALADSGTLDASSTTGNGGNIELHGDHDIVLKDSAQIIASGTADGGAIHVVADGALATRAGSLIDAHATQHNGRGGYLELSGHGKTTIRGKMNLGQGGTLTIDPTNLTIAAGGGTNSSGTLSATWFQNSLESFLKSGVNVNLVATNSLTMNSLGGGTLDGTNNGTGGSLLLGIGTLVGGGPTTGGTYVQGAGGTISFQNPADSIHVDGNLTLNAGSNTGVINVGNLQAGSINLNGKTSITTGTLTASLGNMMITGGNITTGSIDVHNTQLKQSALTITSTGNVTVNGGISVAGGGGTGTFDTSASPVQASAQITTSKAIKVSGDITVTGNAFTRTSGSSVDSEGGGKLSLQGSKVTLAGVSVSGVGSASFQATASQSITIGSAVNVTASRTNIKRSSGSNSFDMFGNASILLGALNGSGSSALSITTHGLSATGPNAGISVTGGTLNLNNGPTGVAISAKALTGGTSTGGSGAFYQHSYGGGNGLVTTDFGAAAVSVDRVGSGTTKIGAISVSGPAAALLLQGSGGVTTVNGNISVQASGYTVTGSASQFPAFRGLGAPVNGFGNTALLLRPPMILTGTTHWGTAMFIAGGSNAATGDTINITGGVTVSGLGTASVKVDAAGLTVGHAMSVTAAKGSLQGVATTNYSNSSTQSFGSITRTISNSAGTGAATVGQAGVAVNIGTGDVSIGSLSVRGLSAETSLQGGRNISITGGVTVDGQFGGSAPDYKEVATVHHSTGGSSTGTTNWVGDNNFLKIGGVTNPTGAVSLGDVSLSGYGLVNMAIEGGSVSMGNVTVTQATGLFTSTDMTRYSTSYSLTTPGTSIVLAASSGPVQANSLTVTSAGALAQSMSVSVANAYSVTAPSYTTVVSGIGSLPNPLLSPAPSAPGNAISVPADGTLQGVSVAATDISLNISGNLALTTQSLAASHNLSIQTGGNLTLSSDSLGGGNSMSLIAGNAFSDTNSTLLSPAVTISAKNSLNLTGTTIEADAVGDRGSISLTGTTIGLSSGEALRGTNVTLDVTGGDLTLTNNVLDASSALTLTASGAISATNSVLLGDVTNITGTNGITITDSTVAGAGGTTASTSITMTSGNGVITGTGSTVVEGVTVDMTALGFISNVTTATPLISANDLTLDATATTLTLGPSVALNVTNNLLLESQTGSVDVTQALTAGGSITISAANGAVATQGLTAGTSIALTAGNGDVTATQVLNAGTGVTITATKGSVTTQAIAAGGAVTINASNAISTGNIGGANSVGGATSIDLNAGTTLATGNDGATGNITLVSGTGITLTNNVLSAGGVLSLTAATGDVSATNATMTGSDIVLLATTGSIALNNSLLSANSIGAIAGTSINITHSALGGGANSPSAALIALSANGGDITLDHATALTGDAVGLFATGSITSTNTTGETTIINAGALSAQAFNTIDLSQATLEIGTGTAQFGGDSALLQQIAQQSGGKIVLPSAGPNASFKAKVVNLGTIQTQTAGDDLYLYIESLATSSGLGYSIASINGAGNALLDYNLYGGDVQVVNLPAGAKPIIGSQATTTSTPLTINGTVNAPVGLTTLVIGSSLYGGDITVSPGTVFTPNDPASVNLVLATTGTVSGADNLHTTGYVLLLNQVASTPVTLPITPGDYAPPPTGGIGGPQPPPSDPDDPGVNDGNKGTIQQQTSSQGVLSSCGGT